MQWRHLAALKKMPLLRRVQVLCYDYEDEDIEPPRSDTPSQDPGTLHTSTSTLAPNRAPNTPHACSQDPGSQDSSADQLSVSTRHGSSNSSSQDPPHQVASQDSLQDLGEAPAGLQWLRLLLPREQALYLVASHRHSLRELQLMAGRRVRTGTVHGLGRCE